MTYALSWPLQQAVYQLLAGTPGVTALAGDRIYDAPLPPAAEAEPAGLYVTLGDERVEDWSTTTDRGAAHLLTIAVHAPRRGFGEAKELAGAISDALLGGELSLSRGRAVLIHFAGARTRRQEGDALRRIEVRFRVTVEDTV